MKRLVCSMLFLALTLAVLPAAATTVTGRSDDAGWRVTSNVGGQLVLTVYWNKKNALLWLQGSCDDGAMFVSGSLQDRFQRVEIGVDPGATCDIRIRSRRSSSKYWFNIQGTGVFGARTPDLEVKQVTDSSPAAPSGEGTGRRVRPKSR